MFWKYEATQHEQAEHARAHQQKQSRTHAVRRAAAPLINRGKTALAWIGGATLLVIIAPVLLLSGTDDGPSVQPAITSQPPRPTASTAEAKATPASTPDPITPTAEQVWRARVFDDTIACKERIRSIAKYPNSVNFPLLAPRTSTEQTNGNHLLKIAFTAKNAFGMESESRAVCIFDAAGQWVDFAAHDSR